jgi:hypothetical protein
MVEQTERIEVVMKEILKGFDLVESMVLSRVDWMAEK